MTEKDNPEGFEPDGFPPRGKRKTNQFAELEKANGTVTMDLVSDDEKRIAFRVLLEEGGNAAAATDRLWPEHQIAAMPDELVRWRDQTHSKLWVEVSEEYGRELEARIESQARSRAIKAGRIADKAIDHAENVIGSADALETSKLLDSLVKAGTAATNQVLQMSGRPVDGSSGDWSAAIKALDRLGVLVPIAEATADDVPDVEVVEEGAA